MSKYILGDDPQDFKKDYFPYFQKRNAKKPGYLEIIGYETYTIANRILDRTNFEVREELDSRVKELNDIQGVTGSWSLKDGIWIKDLDFIRIRRGNIEKPKLSNTNI